VESAPSSSKPSSTLSFDIIKNRLVTAGISLAPSRSGKGFLWGSGVEYAEIETRLDRNESIRDWKKDSGRDDDKKESLPAP